ncbi:hypothetical protein ACFW6C_28550 [Streptomyces fungicidicus]|uniref:hypothetical protein n=1 Tax=Streptomyces fungicidicus TaxID=68203 RepID=UPI00331A23F4
MPDHYMGGVTMARGCARQCTVPQERRLAQGMAEAQQPEMNLEGLRVEGIPMYSERRP